MAAFTLYLYGIQVSLFGIISLSFIRNLMKIGFQFDLDINKHCCMSSFFALIISHMWNSSNNPPLVPAVVAKAHLRSYRVREKKNICGPKNVPWGKLRSTAYTYEVRSSLCRAILLSVMRCGVVLQECIYRDKCSLCLTKHVQQFKVYSGTVHFNNVRH